MSVQAVFQIASEQISVIIDGNNLMFADESGTITTIQGLRLNQKGVIKEHPDLKNDSEWRKKAIERLKIYFKNLKSQKARLDYIKEELTKFGYEPCFYQRSGFRPQKWK